MRKLGGLTLEALKIAREAVEAAGEKQAGNIALLDVREVCNFADYFVLCNGDSGRQVQAIYEEIEQVLKKAKELPNYREGTSDSGWMLLDYGDVVVHIFAPFERELYQLDELWKAATPVLRIQ
ncbi:MAG: ribosome silencing factor [Dehalococcoidales bacterium]|nr:ribosome silencing factor [Dehalococcoidales bacterium]